jgi:DNA (cytosine-5)-methyltransferase 1
MDGTGERHGAEPLTSLEICAGAGGQAIGLHNAGFRHLALVEYDRHATDTLRANVAGNGEWGKCELLEEDLHDFDHTRPMAALGNTDTGARELIPGELDLLSGGVPCPPFSMAGKQLGDQDERNLFPRMMEIVDGLQPRAVMIENVRGIAHSKFGEYLEKDIRSRIMHGSGEVKRKHSYSFCDWRFLEARAFGVPQLRPRFIMVALRDDVVAERGGSSFSFPWPEAVSGPPTSVYAALKPSMERRRDVLRRMHKPLEKDIEEAYSRWEKKAQASQEVPAPTLVGGSRKHGGADLGPSRAKAAWRALGVDAMGVANEPGEGCAVPLGAECTGVKCSVERDFLRAAGPMLTVSQAAIIQGFPSDWVFKGGKTAQYRQVGNAFPPPVAEAVGRAIASVLTGDTRRLHGLEVSQERDDTGRSCQQTTLHIAADSLNAASAASAPLVDCSGNLVSAGN